MAKSLHYRPLRLFNDRPNPLAERRAITTLINWGNGNANAFATVPKQATGRIINCISAVAVASNKLSTFNKLKDKDGIRIPAFTTDRSVAEQWMATDKIRVVCRTQLNGHSGAGIVLADTVGDLVQAPLYVQYVKKEKEFRVHVAFGEVIDVQEKRKRQEVPKEDVNFQIRNHQTGWVYCREDIVEPEGLRQMAVRSVQEVGLDFGAVDLIYNVKRNEIYTLEINSAPGIENSTVEKYAKVFVKALAFNAAERSS